MLTGAARAAKTAGVVRLERVWIVAVPVVVVLMLERLFTYYFLYWGLGAYGFTHPYAELAGRAGPMSLRTALVATSFAITGYALVWTVIAVADYAREVRRRGRWIRVQGGATGRLLVFGALFLLLVHATTIVSSLPTAADIMADAEAGYRDGDWWTFNAAVIHDVPGIRRLCREGLNHPSRPHQLMAAMGLKRLGEESEQSVALLRSFSRAEYCDPENRSFVFSLQRVSTGLPYLLPPFRTTEGKTPEEQERLYQEFRRKHIP